METIKFSSRLHKKVNEIKKKRHCKVMFFSWFCSIFIEFESIMCDNVTEWERETEGSLWYSERPNLRWQKVQFQTHSSQKINQLFFCYINKWPTNVIVFVFLMVLLPSLALSRASKSFFHSCWGEDIKDPSGMLTPRNWALFLVLPSRAKL